MQYGKRVKLLIALENLGDYCKTGVIILYCLISMLQRGIYEGWEVSRYIVNIYNKDVPT